MNAVADEQHDAPGPATAEQLREIADLKYVMDVLEQRSGFESTGVLWRIRLKVARHMIGVLLRRAGVTGQEPLTPPGSVAQDELRKTHWMLQLDSPRLVPAARDAEWKRELNLKVARFADRVRSRRISEGTDPEN